jgi:hypothetical protein
MHRAAILAGVFLLLAACGGTTPAATSGIAIATALPTQGVAVATTPLATVAPATIAPPTGAPATLAPVIPTVPPPTAAPGIGVPMRIADQQIITALEFEQWDGTATVKPATGKVFMTVFVRIDAITLTSFDSADFKLRDDGLEKSYAWRQGRASHLYSSSALSAEHYYQGWITYEVPKAAEGPFILVYRPTFEADAVYRIPLS